MNAKPFILALFCVTAVCMAGYSQCSMPFPPSATNLCLQGQASISNTSTTITIPNPTTVPASGSYTVSFAYFSRTTGRCSGVITCAAATIAASGSELVINLGSCTTLPANFYLSPNMQINMVSNFGGANYFFLYVNRDCGLPLPIDIAYFEVESIANGEVTLVWATTSEVDASHFIVERISGVDVPDPDMSLGRVDAIYPNGGTYHFTDPYALNGFNAYRLRMVDDDGSYDATNYAYTVCTNCTNTPPPVDCSTIGINATDVFCSGIRQAAVNHLPYYCSVTWDLPSPAVTLSNIYGPVTTLTQVGNGVVSLNATLSGCTPQTANKTKSIRVGKIISGTVDGIFGGELQELHHDGTEHLLTRGYYVVNINDPDPTAHTPTWTLLQGNLTSWQWNATANRLEFWFPFMGHGYGIFQMTIDTDCGPVTNTYTFIEFNVPPTPFYVLSPNPATSTLNLSVDNRKLQQQKITPSSEHTIRQVMIYDKNGTLVLQQKYPVNATSVSLPVAGLKADVYTVRVFNGKEWQAIKFIKQ